MYIYKGTAAQEVRKLPVPAVGRRWRRADTNVVSITFDVLTKPSNMHTGDAAKCGKCEALMSHISKLHEVDGQTVCIHGSASVKLKLYWI